MVDRNKELAINTVILGIGQLIPKFLGIWKLRSDFKHCEFIDSGCNHANTASSISLLACIEER